jgi:hypothetical protein
MIRLNFPIICLIIFLSVLVSASLISPYLDSPVTNITVEPYREVMAETENGNVTKEGPFGNATSPVKIAYIVGVHPWEQYSHDAAVDAVRKNSKSLKYQYYIYKITVPGGIDTDYETGRMEGQVLAEQYVVPDILKSNYQLAVDIHSNKGGEDFYEINWFISVPYNETKSNQYAQELQSRIPGLALYNPPLASSPYYVTIPIIQNGTPAIIYEAYAYDPPETRLALAEKFLRAIDSLPFKYSVEQYN